MKRKCRGLTRLLYGFWRRCDNTAEDGKDYCRAHRYENACPNCRGTGRTRGSTPLRRRQRIVGP